MTDNRVCRICDGGPGNDCACTCGSELWETTMTDKTEPALEPIGDEVERLRAALRDLVTAVCYNDPPKLFNGVECHEARVPVEFIQIAHQALKGTPA